MTQAVLEGVPCFSYFRMPALSDSSFSPLFLLLPLSALLYERAKRKDDHGVLMPSVTLDVLVGVVGQNEETG